MFLGPMRLQMRRTVLAGMTAFVVAVLGVIPPAAGAKPRAPELISRATGNSGEIANRASTGAAISADGRFVAFTSRATNLDAADSDTVNDVYVRDRAAATTTLVSRATGADGEKANSFSVQPSISADGRSVAFGSLAGNLVPGVSGSQVYVRDLLTNMTTLVSRGTGPDGPPANYDTGASSISADGRFVSFVSSSDNFGYSDVGNEVYVRDLVAETTTLVSRDKTGAPARGGTLGSAISANGSRVAFVSFALNGALDESNGTLIVGDLPSETTILASPWRKSENKPAATNFIGPSISDDGNRTPFETSVAVLSPKDDSGDRDVFLRDIAAKRTRLVSRGFGAERTRGVRDAVRPDVSGNGGFVSFTAGRRFLDDGGRPQGQGLFVRNVKVERTTHIPGTPGSGTTDSLFSALSRNGRILGFSSDADDLVRGDQNDSPDVFAIRVGG